MIYIMGKATLKVFGWFSTLSKAKEYVSNNSIDENSILYLMEYSNMYYISKIVYYDNTIIYNNKTFWTETAWSNDLITNFSSHSFLDFFGNSVDLERFKIELYENSNRINLINDQVDEGFLNCNIGKELITLFRSEVSQTTLSSITVSDIFTKIKSASEAVLNGSFDMAEELISAYDTDEYFTTDRISKYVNMLKSADMFTYAS